MKRRVALVLSGGGARGAYEAGVLSYLFEHVYPDLPPAFEFDIVSGTSVGAIHAAYVAASAMLPGRVRSKELLETWRRMRLRDVVKLRANDVLGVPLRALGLTRLIRNGDGEAPNQAVGGLVDLTPLEKLIAERIPWGALRENLARGRPGALCVCCSEVGSGGITVFQDGPLADPRPWTSDPNARAVLTEIHSSHVRASAAIPFLFPAIRIGERYYVDGGVRMNTPLAPALRLAADRVLVVALKHAPRNAGAPIDDPDPITQPAFLLGKVLNALLLDQLEYELRTMELVNTWIARGAQIYGEDFLDRINVAVRAQRGLGYRPVKAATVRPSADIGRLAARCHTRSGGRELSALPALLTRLARRGVPEDEADLLSYLYFDTAFTAQLVELGREDAHRQHDEILDLLLREDDLARLRSAI